MFNKQLQILTIIEKIKLLQEKEQEYLNGYVDRALKDYPKKKGA